LYVLLVRGDELRVFGTYPELYDYLTSRVPSNYAVYEMGLIHPENLIWKLEDGIRTNGPKYLSPT
jgi:hypothetical protein